MWVLETEPGSPGRAASALNCRAFCPVQQHRHLERELLKLSFSRETGDWCCRFPSTVTVNLGCFILAEGFRTWLLVLVAFFSWGNSLFLCHTHHVILSLWSEVRPCLPHSWDEAKTGSCQDPSVAFKNDTSGHWTPLAKGFTSYQ